VKRLDGSLLNKAHAKLSAFAAVLVSLSNFAAAEESQRWVGGWGINGAGGHRTPFVTPFVPEGADEAVVPEGYYNLAGRPLYFLDQFGRAGVGKVARLDVEPGACLAEIVLKDWPPFLADESYLGSTHPITVAKADNIPLTDARVVIGIVRYLESKGVKNPDVEVQKAMNADIDQDGRFETLVQANTRGRELWDIDIGDQPGDFSLVAVGEIADEGYVVKDHVGYINVVDNVTRSTFELVALPDFAGSGHFDVAISYYGWEWAGMDVYAWRGGTLVPLASAECGL
jgi:hypothetical protein